MRQRVRGRRPKNRSKQRRKGGEKSGSTASETFLVAQVVVFLFGRRSVCLGPGLAAVWSFPVLGAGWRSRVPSSLVVGWCPCLPGSGFCAAFREKGRRPKNRSRHSFASAGPFQVFPGMFAVLERRYRGGLLPFLTASSISDKASPHAFNPPAGAGGRHSGLSVEAPCSASQRICFVVQLSFEVSGIPTILTVLSRTRLLFEKSWGHYRCGRFRAMQVRFEFDVASSENLVVDVKLRVVPLCLARLTWCERVGYRPTSGRPSFETSSDPVPSFRRSWIAPGGWPLRPTLSPPQRVISHSHFGPHYEVEEHCVHCEHRTLLTTRSSSLAQGSPFSLRTRRSCGPFQGSALPLISCVVDELCSVPGFTPEIFSESTLGGERSL